VRRLLFVAPSAYPLGGVANWLDYLLPGLHASGWQVFIGLVDGHFHNVERYLHQHPFKDVLRIYNPTGSREGRIRAIRRALEICNPNIAVSVNIPDLYLAVNRLKNSDTAPLCVASMHGFTPEYFDDMKSFSSCIDGVICTNRLTAALVVEETGITADRVFYAPYGVREPLAVRKNVESSVFEILYVGRLDEPQKAVSHLVGIVAKLSTLIAKFRLTVVGTGPDQRLLEKELKRRGLNDLVRFEGSVPAHKVATYYDLADVLLITSQWETGPLVAWEAMASGLPVVTSRYIGSGLEDSLQDGKNCLMFDVRDTETAANCLLRIQKCKALGARLAAGGLELVENRYSEQASIALWHRALEALAVRKPLPRCSEPCIGKSGRVDRVLGPQMGESIRRTLGIRYLHNNPGGEWPHSYGSAPIDDSEFWDLVKHMDVGEP
jgi:glycosyltransferase involved in cell wall biosynthesis